MCKEEVQVCVRRRAIKSLLASPYCTSETEAATAVDAAWKPCFADTEPFERIP